MSLPELGDSRLCCALGWGHGGPGRCGQHFPSVAFVDRGPASLQEGRAPCRGPLSPELGPSGPGWPRARLRGGRGGDSMGCRAVTRLTPRTGLRQQLRQQARLCAARRPGPRGRPRRVTDTPLPELPFPPLRSEATGACPVGAMGDMRSPGRPCWAAEAAGRPASPSSRTGAPGQSSSTSGIGAPALRLPVHRRRCPRARRLTPHPRADASRPGPGTLPPPWSLQRAGDSAAQGPPGGSGDGVSRSFPVASSAEPLGPGKSRILSVGARASSGTPCCHAWAP